MDKMKMESVDMTAQNIEKIGALFPNCITEMLDEERSTPEKKVYKKAINFELLKQMLSGDVLEGDEAYEFTWVGKKASIVEANKPIRKTLRPCPEESVNWDTTENLYIEGDNLDVLKLLQESYLGKIKMIYIDPPYNTGRNLIYRNDFHVDTDEYLEESGQTNTEGKLVTNPKTYGRFHSAWLSMIYQRLLLARNLLSKDGVLVCAIDENEQASVLLILKELFGEGGYEHVCVSIVHNPGGTQGKNFSYTHEYAIFVFPQSQERMIQLQDRTDTPDIRPLRDVSKGNNMRTDAKNCFYPILVKDNQIIGFGEVSDDLYHPESANIIRADGVIEIYPIDASGNERKWVWARQTVESILDELRVVYNKKRNIIDIERVKTHFNYKTVWTDERYNANSYGTKLLSKLMPNSGFSFPKSLFTVLECVRAVTLNDKDAIVLDFFSGSATTPHAVMQMNSEDCGKRKYIAVQLPEDLDLSLQTATGETKKSLQQSIKFLNSLSVPHMLTEIGKERIRRAGKKIKEENPNAKDLDTGFRVLKLDESNMNDVYYSPAEYSQDLLSMLESNVKSDRNDLDLLFGCLLEWGLPLSLPYSSEQIDGCTVHNYNDGDLIACFDENVPDSVIKEIARKQPLRAVFRDSSFVNSPSKINVGEIFKLMAPDTRVKVI